MNRQRCIDCGKRLRRRWKCAECRRLGALLAQIHRGRTEADEAADRLAIHQRRAKSLKEVTP